MLITFVHTSGRRMTVWLDKPNLLEQRDSRQTRRGRIVEEYADLGWKPAE